jgi:hypothetical protein
MPVTIPAASAAAKANPKTPASRCTTRGTLVPQTLGRAKNEPIQRLAGPAMASAVAPAARPKSRLSVRNCRSRRPRDAPMAARTASSRSRRVPNASIMLATLTHARSKSPAAAESMIRAVGSSDSRAAGSTQVARSSVKRRGPASRGATASSPVPNAARAALAWGCERAPATRTNGKMACPSRLDARSERAQYTRLYSSNGSHTWGRRSELVPKNSGAVTPTMVYGLLFRKSVLPTAAVSAAKRSVQ